jgi:hypothetical protein
MPTSSSPQPSALASRAGGRRPADQDARPLEDHHHVAGLGIDPQAADAHRTKRRAVLNLDLRGHDGVAATPIDRLVHLHVEHNAHCKKDQRPEGDDEFTDVHKIPKTSKTILFALCISIHPSAKGCVTKTAL